MSRSVSPTNSDQPSARSGRWSRRDRALLQAMSPNSDGSTAPEAEQDVAAVRAGMDAPRHVVERGRRRGAGGRRRAPGSRCRSAARARRAAMTRAAAARQPLRRDRPRPGRDRRTPGGQIAAPRGIVGVRARRTVRACRARRPRAARPCPVEHFARPAAPRLAPRAPGSAGSSPCPGTGALAKMTIRVAASSPRRQRWQRSTQAQQRARAGAPSAIRPRHICWPRPWSDRRGSCRGSC